MSILDQYLQHAKSVNCIMCSETTMSSIPVCESCRKKNSQEESDIIKTIEIVLNEEENLTPESISPLTGIKIPIVKWYYQKGNLMPRGKRCIDNGDKTGISIYASRYDKYIIIELGGRIDSQNAGILQEYIDTLTDDRWTHIILSMQEVKFLSSNGIRTIITTYKKLNDTGSFYITNPSTNVENVLGMVALERLLLKWGVYV